MSDAGIRNLVCHPLVQAGWHWEYGDFWRETEMRSFLDPFLATGISGDVLSSPEENNLPLASEEALLDWVLSLPGSLALVFG